MQFCVKFFCPSLTSSSKKRRKEHRISRCIKGGNSKDGRRGATSSHFHIPGSIKQTFLGAVRISAARSSKVHNMQGSASLPTNESTNHAAKYEKSLWNQVQYRYRKLNTQDENIDKLIMEVMTHEENENIFLGMEDKSLLLASKAEEPAAESLAKLDAVKGRFWASSEKKCTSYGRCETGQRSRMKHSVT